MKNIFAAEQIDRINSILKQYSDKKITTYDILRQLKKMNYSISSIRLQSLKRELLRFGALKKSQHSYIINKSNVDFAWNKINSFEPMPKNKNKILRLFYKKNIYNRNEINDILSNYSIIAIDHFINDLRKAGLIEKVFGDQSRGNYFFYKNKKHKNSYINPINLINEFFSGDVIFCYNTALEFYGLSRYGMSNTIYISKRMKEKFNSNIIIKSVNLPSENTGKTLVKYKNSQICITDLDRTILDCVRFPKYAIGWENVVYALNKTHEIDGDQILSYLKKLKIPSLNAKMGFILQYYQKKWNIHEKTLSYLKQICPMSPVHFFWNVPGVLNKDWNIYIPENLLM